MGFETATPGRLRSCAFSECEVASFDSNAVTHMNSSPMGERTHGDYDHVDPSVSAVKSARWGLAHCHATQIPSLSP
jgi:hypothetical protein